MTDDTTPTDDNDPWLAALRRERVHELLERSQLTPEEHAELKAEIARACRAIYEWENTPEALSDEDCEWLKDKPAGNELP